MFAFLVLLNNDETNTSWKASLCIRLPKEHGLTTHRKIIWNYFMSFSSKPSRVLWYTSYLFSCSHSYNFLNLNPLLMKVKSLQYYLGSVVGTAFIIHYVLWVTFPAFGIRQWSEEYKWIFKPLNNKRLFKIIETCSLVIAKFKGNFCFHKVKF